jgi:hypothetical protein
MKRIAVAIFAVASLNLMGCAAMSTKRTGGAQIQRTADAPTLDHGTVAAPEVGLR